MNREKKLLQNTIILTIGSICTKLITFFLLPLYTKVLSTSEYGIVDLLNTLVSLLLPVVTLQIEQGVFRNLIDIRENEKEKKKVISTAVFITTFQCVVYLLFFCSISIFINNEYKWYLVLNLFAYIFSSIFQQISRGFGDNKSFSISSVISAVITIVFNLFFILGIKIGAKGMLLGTMIGQLICSIYLIQKLKLYTYINIKYFDKNILKKLLRYSIPLIPNSISWWIFNASDRIIVSMFLGLSMTGILAASHKFSTVYITFYNIFHLSWLESISMHINDKDISKFFNKMLNTALNVFLAIGMLIIATMPFVYPIMINKNYFEGYYQVPIIMVGSIFNVIVALETALYVAQKNTRAIANTSVISAIINVIIHLALIKFIGLYAATISTLIAYMVMSVYRYVDIKKKYLKICFSKKSIVLTILVLIFIIPIYYSKSQILYLIGLVITLFYSYILNANSLQLIIKTVKEKFMYKGVE